mmetsp:Transcript_7447/g.12559  ORF Transcript_7447/g.12559 Transcript_7447/m.12559 type:complete len:327 (+) Transcript_7447:523-1503(+)
MFASGTLARTTFMLPRSASSSTIPRLLLMSPITSPIDSSGVVTSTFIIGSISCAPAARRPLRAHCRPAISKAMTDESTSWKPPSTRVALHPMTGKPARTPLVIIDSRPLAAPGMYSLGTEPPLMSWSKMKPTGPSSSSAASSGSNLTTILAYWPEPPDCFLWVYSTVADFVIASRYATCGAPMVHSTLNSRIMRSQMISRWSSPMPSMTVWPDSSSREKRKEGSSAASLISALVILSWSALVFGSTDTLITGSGKSIFSRMTGEEGSHRVSPVVVSLQPTTAMMSPARASSMSIRSLAFISSMRPILSFLPLTELSTDWPFSSTPE